MSAPKEPSEAAKACAAKVRDRAQDFCFGGGDQEESALALLFDEHLQRAVQAEREAQAVAYLARHLCSDHRRESLTTGGAYPGEGRSCRNCEHAVEYAAAIRERR